MPELSIAEWKDALHIPIGHQVSYYQLSQRDHLAAKSPKKKRTQKEFALAEIFSSLKLRSTLTISLQPS